MASGREPSTGDEPRPLAKSTSVGVESELVRQTDRSEQRAVQTTPRLASLAGVLAIPRQTYLLRNLDLRNLLFALLLGFAAGAASSPHCPSLRAMVASRMEDVANVPLGALRRDLKVLLPWCCSEPEIRMLCMTDNANQTSSETSTVRISTHFEGTEVGLCGILNVDAPSHFSKAGVSASAERPPGRNGGYSRPSLPGQFTPLGLPTRTPHPLHIFPRPAPSAPPATQEP